MVVSLLITIFVGILGGSVSFKVDELKATLSDEILLTISFARTVKL